MTIAAGRRWQPSPAHFRAATFGILGTLAALLFRSPALLVLAAPFAVVAMWSTVTRPIQLPEIRTRLEPGTVREGEATTWTATVTGAGADTDAGPAGVDHVIAFVPRQPWLETRPASGSTATGLETRPSSGSTATGVEPNAEEASVTVAIRVTHWGRHDVGPVNVAAVSAWGAFRSHALDRGLRVSALPLPDVFDAAPPRFRADGLVGVNRSIRPGEGGEFAGLRPFQTGDRLRRINWRRSVRVGELQVTATYADQDAHIALLIDAFGDYGPSGGIDGSASSLDTAVRAAGAIAEHFVLRGERVSLRVLGSHRSPKVPPAGGSGHLRRILDVLASVEPEPFRSTILRNPDDALPHGSLAVMFSPLISPGALEQAATVAQHGISVAVVDTLPTDIHLDGDASAELAWRIRLLERRQEMRAIQRLGVPINAWSGPGSLDLFLRDVARRSSAPRMSRR